MSRLRVETIVAAVVLVATAVSPAVANTGATAAPSPTATAAGPGTGAAAPKLVLQSVVAGKAETFDLQASAAKKPIVLYFFPKAFTAG